MNYFVIQVKTRGEDKYLRLAKNSITVEQLPESDGRLLWPRRKLTIRKGGVKKQSEAPIFPGYVFLEADSLSTEMYWTLKRTPGFFRFLKSNQQIEPLTGKDRELLTHFLNFGEIVNKSKVFFDENKRIRVIEGPMKGLEGYVVKVDRRKQRARIALSLYEDSFQIDFGFETLELASEKNEQKK